MLVATDDARIEAAARGFGAPVVMTSPAHASGTDRIAEAAARAGWEPRDIVVNLQGDEPLLPAVLLRQVAQLLQQHPGADVATLAVPIDSVSFKRRNEDLVGQWDVRLGGRVLTRF